jgi:hypothetical protein
MLELKLPYDAHTVFSATDGIKEPLSQLHNLLIATNKFTVSGIDLRDSGIPRCILYYHRETV